LGECSHARVTSRHLDCFLHLQHPPAPVRVCILCVRVRAYVCMYTIFLVSVSVPGSRSALPACPSLCLSFTFVFVYFCIFVCMCALHMCACVCVCVCMCVCGCVYMCMCVLQRVSVHVLVADCWMDAGVHTSRRIST